MIYVLIIFGAFFLVGYVWLYYAAVMSLKKRREDVGLPTKIVGYPLAAVGLVLNFVFNLVVGSVVFLDPPRWGEVGLTMRLKRYIHGDAARWRKALARWVCHHFLDPFDPGGHC